MRTSQYRFRYGAGIDTVALEVRAAKLLKFIIAYIAASGGVAPSFTEMALGVGLKSKSNVHRLLCHLEAEGRIRQMPGRARALEITKQAYFMFDDETKNLVLMKT